MAPKLAILLAMFSLLAMRHVSAFRATVTTTVVEEENPEREQQHQCQEQIQRQRSLQSCQRYLSQQQRSFYDVAMVVMNPQQQEILSQCCAELRNIDEQCRCQAVSHAFRQQRQQGESPRPVKERQTRQLAESLPSKCDLSPQQCQVESVWA